MPRAKTGFKRRRRHKKLLERTEGFYGAKHRTYRAAKEALDHAGVYAYEHRKLKKREFRYLWQTRISAACKGLGLSYSRFINHLKVKKIGLNRKMLSELATTEPKDFASLVEQSRI